jgi:hypothetical protein
MKRRNTLSLIFLSLCVLGGGTFWISSTSHAGAQHKVNSGVTSGAGQRRLGIEIGLTKTFMVPAATKGHITETFLRVQPNAKGSIAAVKLAPKMIGAKVEVIVSVMSGDSSLIKSCADWSKLTESRVASYSLNEGEQVTVPQLSNLGANFKDGTVSFKVVSFLASPDEESGCGCGRCVDLECCPNKGQCIGCGQCGDVCCRITEEQ